MVPEDVRRAAEALLAENDRLRSDIDRLHADNDELRADNTRLRSENGRLDRRLRDIEELLEASRRAGKRQAAPFSKGEPTESPKRPGRRAGADYGKKGRREPPDHVDETVAVPLPELCGCGGRIDEVGVVEQFQEEVPEPRPIVIRFEISIGRCQRCGRRIQSRDPRQTSDAIGAAAAQLGPRAQAIASVLIKRLGLSAVKASEVMQHLSGITVTPAGLIQATRRLADDTSPAYEALRAGVRQSPMVSPDETGWRIGGHKAWLWTAATPDTTVYQIELSRGGDVVKDLLGEEYAGIVVRDGWAAYRQLTSAEHQTCLAHLLRRCDEILEGARGRAREVPRAVRSILKDALALRDRRDRGELTEVAVARAVRRLERRMTTLLERPAITRAENRKLLKHLDTEYEALFTFLRHRNVDATNWRAEQAIRPAVVNRKVSGGNRTRRGARTQQVLMSVIQTCRQRGVDVIGFLSDAQRYQARGSPVLVPAGSG